MADLEFKFDKEWKQLVSSNSLAAQASIQGLRRAGGQAIKEVNDNFKKRGRPRRWKKLSKEYKKRKMAGKVERVQEASTAQGLADNILTGALIRASVMAPSYKLSPYMLIFWPDPALRLGRKRVGDYMNHVNAVRPFYTLTPAASKRIAREYAIGFARVLRGFSDPAGRIFK